MEGTAFGRYQLLQVLGRGGMGVVWRAHDTATDRVVAVKLLPAHLADDETFVKRFRREAHAAAQLNSPHVIPIHNYGEIDGRLYVDMRLIEGRDLAAVLADGPLETERAVRIIEQVAKALHAAHKVGLVHRDVKPSNILLDEDDFAYLIDFGIARAAADTRLTGTDGMIGTLHYMAPERLSTGEVDARADIYALACVLYECLTGSRPFPGDGLERQVAAHLSDPPPQPSSTRPELPQDFDAVIARGMAKEPRQRYASTVELAAAAHDAITTPIAKPARSARRRRRRPLHRTHRDVGASGQHRPGNQVTGDRQPAAAATAANCRHRPTTVVAPQNRDHFRRRCAAGGDRRGGRGHRHPQPEPELSAGPRQQTASQQTGSPQQTVHRRPTHHVKRCCRSPASTSRTVWRWTAPEPSTSPTAATTGS